MGRTTDWIVETERRKLVTGFAKSKVTGRRKLVIKTNRVDTVMKSCANTSFIHCPEFIVYMHIIGNNLVQN